MNKLKFSITKKEIVLAIILIIAGFLTRTYLHIGPNIEFITAITLASGYFFKDKKLALFVPLGILVSTDFVIGNTMIFIFTWSGFLFSYILSFVFKKYAKPKSDFKNLVINSESLGIISTFVFFLWTNFGVMLTTNMYSKNIEGLLLSYEMGLPFLVNQLVSNLIIVPLVFCSINIFLNWNLNSNKHFRFEK